MKSKNAFRHDFFVKFKFKFFTSAKKQEKNLSTFTYIMLHTNLSLQTYRYLDEKSLT